MCLGLWLCVYGCLPIGHVVLTFNMRWIINPTYEMLEDLILWISGWMLMMSRISIIKLIHTSKWSVNKRIHRHKLKGQGTGPGTHDFLFCDEIICVTYLDSWLFIQHAIIGTMVTFLKYCLSFWQFVSKSLNLFNRASQSPCFVLWLSISLACLEWMCISHALLLR